MTNADYQRAMLALHGPTKICRHCDMRIAKRSVIGFERLVWIHVAYGTRECPNSTYADPSPEVTG